MALSIGDKIPNLTLPASGGKDISLAKDFKGKALVVYFYPKDNTPGCTQEGQDFRDLHAKFKRAGAEILGVSKDSVKSHDNFIAKFEFPFKLLADTEGAACEAFDAIVEKTCTAASTWVSTDAPGCSMTRASLRRSGARSRSKGMPKKSWLR